jgi:hypothetical protein
MAGDVVTSTLLENGPSRWAYCFTGYSDGTGESGVVKVDASSDGDLGVVVQGQTFYPGVHLVVTGLWYCVSNMVLEMLWQADSSTDFLVLQGFGRMDFRDSKGGIQGLINPAATGATGSILFTTTFAGPGAVGPPVTQPGSYSIIMQGLKGIPQS